MLPNLLNFRILLIGTLSGVHAPLWKPQNSPQMRKCILDAPKPHNKSGTLFPETIVFDKLETDAENVT